MSLPDKNNYFDTIIIGGGPAGLLAAASLKNNTVLLFEKSELPGRKLLISGSGQCNYTHAGSIYDFLKHYGRNFRFLKHAFKAFSNADTIHFFKESGIESIEDKNGKIFPASLNSNDVLRALLEKCRISQVNILNANPVKKVEYFDCSFLIKTEKASFKSKNLLIATGGLSYPKTGSTGDGYKFAEMLGHTIVKPKPALSPVIVNDYRLSHLMGISLTSVKISLYRGEKKAGEHCGDLVFTHKGLSGPGILDFSRFIQDGDILKLNLAGVSPDNFNRKFILDSQVNGKDTLQAWLKPYNIPRNLLRFLVNEAGTEPYQQIAGISRNIRFRLSELLCECPFIIEKVEGYKSAMVTTGGVALEEVSSKTMESKLISNLYFAGEVLDIDGDTGGYNIQAAFSTAFLAAKSINLKSGL
jgi:hypothetical protein